jgi:hypothetical protein
MIRPSSSCLAVLILCACLSSSARGGQWQDLFDGKSLGDWKVVDAFDFERHGKIEVKDGSLVIGRGEPGSAVRFTGKLPRVNYELSLEAMRVEGEDFFCGLTFPIGDSPCTLICGGWDGTVVGLSNINGEPAVENESTVLKKFNKKQWYQIRLRVTRPKVEVWIDDQKIINVGTRNRKFTIWFEQECAVPLGIATWRTTGAIRNIRTREVELSPFDDALAAWRLADLTDSAGHDSRLTAEGDVEVDVPLEGAARDASLGHGGDGRVARLAGGWLSAGQGAGDELNVATDALTVLVRACDPTGAWNGTLLAKDGTPDQRVFRLASEATPSGKAVAFELGLDGKPGVVRVESPLAGLDPRGWHDILARYDGKRLRLYVDGALKGEVAAEGLIRRNNSEPCLIAAGSRDGKPQDPFRGMIDHVVIWNRAVAEVSP